MNLPGPGSGTCWRCATSRTVLAAGRSRAVVVAFNVVMFTLIEVPLAGYLLRPDQTAARSG